MDTNGHEWTRIRKSVSSVESVVKKALTMELFAQPPVAKKIATAKAAKRTKPEKEEINPSPQ
jgi:hypothetical protein